MSSAAPSQAPVCFLFDNGSLKAASTLALRETARKLAAALGVRVCAVSLLHSSAVEAAELGGKPARLLEPALNDFLTAEPQGRAVLLPLFFGPSGALTDYVPQRIAFLRTKYPHAQIALARCLVAAGEPDTRIAGALAEAVRRTIAQAGLVRPRVVLVDHGSPQRAVTAVRDHLGGQLREMLAGEAAEVGVASMEKRAGAEYAFNDPLLAVRLRTGPFDAGEVVVALQFLSPGRHAGPEGDVAAICAEARAQRPGLRTHLTETVGGDARMVAVLADRWAEALSSLCAAR